MRDRISGATRRCASIGENIALKAQLDALERHLIRVETKRKRVSLGVRAAQVFAHLLRRGDEPFPRYLLSAPRTTIMRWAMRFRSLQRRTLNGGRPPLDDTIAELIVTLKRENPAWGQRRIREELRRMGIRVSEPTIVRILRDHAFSPRPGRKVCFDRVRAAAKDALWALDFFWVKSAKRVWLQALLVIDIHTRELLDVRVHDGWGVDSTWTTRVLNKVLGRTKPSASKARRLLPGGHRFRRAWPSASETLHPTLAADRPRRRGQSARWRGPRPLGRG